MYCSRCHKRVIEFTEYKKTELIQKGDRFVLVKDGGSYVLCRECNEKFERQFLVKEHL